MATTKRDRYAHPEKLRSIKGMDYAPTNEQGVVYLFALMHRKLGFRGIEKIQSGFPDCIARKVIGGKEKEVRIEFEFRSSNFRTHKHPVRGCDCIVCWEHDWRDYPIGKLEIINLRSQCGLGHKVWIQPVNRDYWEELDQKWKRGRWSVPSLAMPGDLLLMYRTQPEKCIRDIMVMTGKAEPHKQWRQAASISRICRLKDPLHLENMRRHRRLGEAGFIRASMQGRPQVTAHWPDLYRLIGDRNPLLRQTLKQYAPEVFTV